MMRNQRTFVIAGAVLALIACSAALALRFMGGNKQPDAGLVKVARRGDVGLTSNDTEAAPERSFDDYRILTRRDVFKPLVSPPQDRAALDVPGEIPSPTGSGRPSGTPSGPPDPTADLAMTGVVESDIGLKALIKNIKTGASVYAGIGETAFGLRVSNIEAKRVALAQGDETYMLAMGAKELPEKAAESGAASRPSEAAAPSQQAGERRGAPRPGFGPGETLRRLEQYRGRMTPEQYQRARGYLEQRGRGGRGPGRGR